MGNLTSRTARVVNRCGVEVQLLIKQHPIKDSKKTITVRQGGYADVSFADVDSTYNTDRPIEVSVEVGGVEMGIVVRGKEMPNITSAMIRDNMKLKLCLVTTENGQGRVTVEPVEGNLFKRLGISWKIRDCFGMTLEQPSSTVGNPENA